MRRFMLVPLFLMGSILFNATANAAFIVEADSDGTPTGKAFANFSSLGHSFSTTPSTAIGLTGNQSVFGNPTNATGPDQYTFRYTPGTDADNTALAVGTVLGNSAATDLDGAGAGAPVYVTAPQLATGVTGGASGLYNVYVTVPPSTNVDAAGSLVEITSDLPTIALNPVNWNNGGTGPDDPDGGVFTGGANSMWLKVATVPLTAGNTYTVTLTANNPTFVSQRAHGVMWEAVVIPEPSSLALVIMGMAAIGLLRGRKNGR